MAKRRIILLGRREFVFEADVPDSQGYEPPASQNERAIRFLNQKYGVGKWRDPNPLTSVGISSSRAFQDAANKENPMHRQLTWLQRHAASSLIKLDKISRNSR